MVGQFLDIAAEVRRRRHRAGLKQRVIHRAGLQLVAMLGARVVGQAAGSFIEIVEVDAEFLVVPPLHKGPQHGKCPVLSFSPRNPPALDGNRQRRELKTYRRDAADRVTGFVLGQQGRRADFPPKVLEATALHLFQQGLVRRREVVFPCGQALGGSLDGRRDGDLLRPCRQTNRTKCKQLHRPTATE